MTKRLQDAVSRLTPEQVEQLATYAEALAGEMQAKATATPATPKLTWVGCLKDGPYRSGLEAQEAAKHHRASLLERGLPR